MNDPYMYFLYSEQQKNRRSEIESKMSRKFVPGNVIVNGQKRPFTEMSPRSTNIFPDVRIVAEGLRSKMKYTDVQIVGAKR